MSIFLKFSKQRNCSAFCTLVSESRYEVQPGCQRLAYVPSGLQSFKPNPAWCCGFMELLFTSSCRCDFWRQSSTIWPPCPKIYPTQHQPIQSHRLVGHTMDKMVLLAPLLVFCHVDHGFPGLGSALQMGCPTRHHSHTSHTRSAMWCARLFSCHGWWDVHFFQNIAHFFVFLSLQRPDQRICCISQRSCCPLEYIEWSCEYALLSYTCFSHQFLPSPSK